MNQQHEEWEMEFSERFSKRLWKLHETDPLLEAQVGEFIRAQITAAEARGRGEAVEYVQKNCGGIIKGVYKLTDGDLEAARTGNLSGGKN